MSTFSAQNRTPVALLGGGGHALVVGDVMLRLGIPIAGIYDDSPSARACSLLGAQRLGPMSDVRGAFALHLAVGDLPARAEILGRLAGTPHQWQTIVSPDAAVSAMAKLGHGAFVGIKAVVNAGARVGAHAIVNTGAIVEHECDIGENSHIAPGAILGGNVRIGTRTLIGTGARVLPGVDIGSGCVVGAGAVVTRNVRDNTTVMGVPARERER